MNVSTRTSTTAKNINCQNQNTNSKSNSPARPALLMRWLFVLLALTVANITFGQVTTNGGSGLAATYSDLTSAIAALNAATISSPVVITVDAGNPQTAPAGTGYYITATGTSTNTIVIDGNGNTITAGANTVAGNMDAVFKIVGGDWITIQNCLIVENTAANTVTATGATNTMTEAGILLIHASATDGAQNNTIQGNTITLSAAYPNAVGILSTSASTTTNASPGANSTADATSTAGTNSSNTVKGNTISSVAYGIMFICPPVTATVFETGNTIGATGAPNTITYGNNTAGTGPWNRASTASAGIVYRNGTGNNISFNSVTTIGTLTLASTGISISSGSAPTGVTYTSTMSNNTVVMTNTGTTAITGIDFGHGIATGTIVGNNNNVTINQTSSAASSAALIGIKANYTAAANTANGNTIVFNQTTSAGSITSAVTGITCSGTCNAITANNNPITIKQSVTGTGTFGSGAIIYIDVTGPSAGSSAALSTASGNTLNTTSSAILSTGAMNVIKQEATIGLFTCTNNICNINRTSASGAINFTLTSNSPSELADTISNNTITFTGLAGTTSSSGIIGSLGGTGTSPKNINNNTISVSGTNTGTVLGIATNWSVANTKGNSITFNTNSTTTTGISFLSSGTGYTCTGNAFDIRTGSTGTAQIFAILGTCAGTNLISNNTLTRLESTGGGAAVPGIQGITVTAGTTNTITNNTFVSLTTSGPTPTGAPAIVGISAQVGTTNIVTNNYVTNISTNATTGSAFILGINVQTGTNNFVFNNKVACISTNASGATTQVNGVRFTGGTLDSLYNNYIGDLTAPNAPTADAIRAINITSAVTSSNVRVYDNTVYLNASGPATFGTTGVFQTASATATTAALDMRNNIIVNLSTPGSTAGVTSALRRSAAATYGNWATTSNNNNLIVGTLGATRAILNDNATVYPTSGSGFAFSNYQSTVAGRDANSFTAEPAFTYSTPGSFFQSVTCTDPTYLHLVPGITTQVESGGQALSTITTDYDGNTRNATKPDIGADEFTGTSPAPIISAVTISPSTVSCTAVSHVVTANVVPTGGTLTTVTLNYTLNGVAQTGIAMTNPSADLVTWTGTIPAASPTNAVVGWSITAVNSNNISTTFNAPSTYQDDPLLGYAATAVAATNPVCSGSPTSLSVSVTKPAPVAPAAASYCASTHASGCSGDDVTHVVLNTLNSTASGCAGTRYTYVTGGGTNTTTLTASTSYNIAVTFGSDGSQFFGLWIDYDHDGTYNSTTEFVASNSVTAGGGGTATVAFTVPATALNGLTHMRLVGGNDSQVLSNNACGASSSGWGETQDFDITITGGASVAPYTGPVSAYSWSDGATVVGTTNPLSVSPTTNTSYTATLTIGGCPLVSSPVAVSVSALPASPVASNTTQCGTHFSSIQAQSGGQNGIFRWYDAMTGGNLLQTGGDHYTVAQVSATTTFYISETAGPLGGCESPRYAVTTTVIPPDAIQASSDVPNVCSGGTANLSVTKTTNTNGNVYNYTWTAAPATNSGITTNTGASIAVTPTAPTANTTFIYTVSADDPVQGCVTSSNISVLVKAPPIIDSIKAHPLTVCSGSPDTLSVYTKGFGAGPTTLPGVYCVPVNTTPKSETITGVTLNGLSLTGFVQSGAGSDFYDIIPPSTTTTTLTAGTTYPMTITTDGINTTAITSVWIDYNRNGAFEASEWTQGFTTGTTGTFNIVVPATAMGGATAMRVRSRNSNNANGPTDACNSFGSGGSIDFTISLIGVLPQNTNFTYAWDGGGSTATVIVNPTNTPTQVYNVVVTDPATTCSATTSVTVNVNPVPATAPNGTSSEQCGTKIPTASVASTTGLPSPIFNWYTQPTGGIALQSSTSTTFTSPVGTTTTFYVSESTAAGCEGPRSAGFTVTISNPDALTVTSTATGPGTSVCIGSSFDLASTYTSDLNTYNSFILTASPATGSGVPSPVTLTFTGTGSDPYTVTPTAAGIYVYTITASDGDCSTFSTITVATNPYPSAVTANASAASVCTGGTVNLTSSANSNFPGGPLVQVINEGFTTVSPLPTGWASQNLSAGVGSTGWFQGNSTVFAANSAPATSYIGANFNNAISGHAISNWLFMPTLLVSNGDVLTFYTRHDPARQDRLEVRLSTNGSSVNAGADSASVGDFSTLLMSVNPNLTGLGYPTTWTQYTVTISGLSAPASGRVAFRYNPTNSNVNADYIGIDDVTYSQVSNQAAQFSWTSAPAGFTSSLQNPTGVVVNGTTTYTVSASNTGGCSTTANVTVTALPLPNAPLGTNSTQCGTKIPTASVATGGAGGNGTFNWYANPTGGSPLQSSTSATYTTAISTVGVTHFYVSEGGTNGCESPRTDVTVTVTAPPTLSITPGGATTFCQGGSVSLSTAPGSDPSYNSFTWSAVPSTGAGLSSTTGSTVTVTPTISGPITYTVTATDGVPVTGCTTSTNIIVTVNSNPVIDSVTATPPAICVPHSSTLNAYSPAVSTGPQTLPVYTAPGITDNTDGDHIALVTFATINNPTPGGDGPDGFEDYTTTVPAPTINSGSTYSLTVHVGDGGTENAGVWFDWNRDGSYDASEFTTIPLTLNTGTDEWEGTISVTVPTNATAGLTGMRVRGRFLTALTGGDALLSYSFGETEEYAVNVIGVVPQNPAYQYTWNTTPAQTGATISVSPTTPGANNYQVTVLNTSTGCSAIGSVSVSVLSVSANVTSSATGAVCPGTAVNLDSHGLGGATLLYSWSDGGATVYPTAATITVNPLVTTTYTVIVTDGCGSQATSSVTVTVTPAPTASITPAGPVTLCAPATQLLTAVTDAGSATYQWTLNGVNISGATSSTYTAATSGTYRVVVTNTVTTCVSTASTGVVVTINPQPSAVTITPPSVTLCTGASQILVASGGGTGTTGAITIGTGTGVTSTTSQPTAFCNRWAQYWNQTVYTAAELQAAGLTANSSITAITYTTTTDGDATNNTNFSIRMGTTANSVLTAFQTTGLSVVFGPTSYTHAVGANLITFTTPYVWDGVSNIILDVRQDGIDALFNASTTFTATTGNMNFEAHTSTTSGTTSLQDLVAATTVTGTASTTRLNVIFTSVGSAPTWSWAPPTGLNTTAGATVIASPLTSTTYTATATNGYGCTNTGTVAVTVNDCPVTINLKFFLQGYYLGGGLMDQVLVNEGVAAQSNETDTVLLELHDATTFALIDSKKAVLLTDGTVSATFGAHPFKPYYIAIKHRNSIQTWTAVPVTITGSTPLYNFTTAASQAFGDNMKLVSGVWTIYTGDLNQDDFIDGNDFSDYDNDSFNGVAGEYKATDFNGDGFVDGNDFSIYDNNSFNGVTAIYPQ